MAPEKTTPMSGNQLRNSFPFSSGYSSNVGPSPVNLHGFRQGVPPPVPPRQSQSYSGYMDYGYNRPYYGYSNYGQYRNYGGYNSYGYSPFSTVSGYGYGGAPSGDVETRFFRNAEESTRATFRMVETIVQTFSSLTMLLESTYFAIMNSFRAILSVAENIARLRSTISQLFSTFALIRFVKWLYRKLMRVKGQDEMSNDELWQKYTNMGKGSNGFQSSTWSGLLMFSVFIVIPYLIHKISNNIKNLQAKGNDPEQWNKSSEPVYTATVLYDFSGTNEDELTVRAGQKIWLAPQSLQPTDCTGWYRATDHHGVGLVPANYVQIIGQLVKKPKQPVAGSSGRLADAVAGSGNVPRNSPSSTQVTKEPVDTAGKSGEVPTPGEFPYNGGKELVTSTEASEASGEPQSANGGFLTSSAVQQYTPSAPITVPGRPVDLPQGTATPAGPGNDSEMQEECRKPVDNPEESC